MYLTANLGRHLNSSCSSRKSFGSFANLILRCYSKNTNVFKTKPLNLTKINVNKPKRFFSMSMFYTQQKPPSQAIRNAQISKNNNIIWYVLSGFVIMVGASYAAVPLFKMFCESQGIDANMDFRDMSIDKLKSKLENIKKVENRDIEVKFLASTATDLLWTFEPSQNSVTVAPGETALAFFKAKNLTNRPIIGIATYSILPYEAGLYFNKIQCFCFEEQRLEPNEEVDMPVFFYIDEQYAHDPKLETINKICLSYTFFESKGSEDLEKLQKLRPYSN